jgi:hypothetical protein
MPVKGIHVQRFAVALLLLLVCLLSSSAGAPCSFAATAVCITPDGACGGQAGVACLDAATGPLPANGSAVTVCGRGSRKTMLCPDGQVVLATGSGDNSGCMVCAPGVTARLLHDSCRWQRGNACPAGDVAAGVEDGSIFCCATLSRTCASRTRWSNLADHAACPAMNAAVGLCSVGCRECVNAAFPSVVVHSLCHGKFSWDSTLVEVCDTVATCPPTMAIRGMSACANDRTGIVCSPLRSGELTRVCVELSGDELLCPTGYLMTAACAAAIEGGCQGRNAWARCCQAQLPYSPTPCSALGGFFPVAGETYHPACEADVKATPALAAQLRGVTAVAANRGKNSVVFASALKLWFVAPQQYGSRDVTPQALTLSASVADIQVQSTTSFHIAEGKTAALAWVGDSGLIWSKEANIGVEAVDNTPYRIIEGGTPKQRLGTIENVASWGTSARSPFLIPTVVSVDNELWRVFFAEGALRRIAGGGSNQTAPAVAKNFVFDNITGLTWLNATSVLVTDGGLSAVLAVHVEGPAAGQLTVFLGTVGVEGSTKCADGVGQVRLKHPSGMAKAVDGSVFVADTGNWCVRRVAAAGTSCVDIGSCGVEHPDFPAMVALSASSTMLFALSEARDAVWGLVLSETIKFQTTRTRTPAPTLSRSLSTSSSPSSTHSIGSVSSSANSSASDSLSVSACGPIRPACEVFGPTEIDATLLRRGAVNLTVRTVTCHQWRLPFVAPRLQLNPGVHPHGEGASAFGVRNVNKSSFLRASPSAQASDVVLTLGPAEEYTPTIPESVDLVWPRDAFDPPAETELSITLFLLPRRTQVFDPLFREVIMYGAGLALVSSIAALSPITAIRAGRLEYLTRISECPVEDTATPLPFTMSPVGIAIGTGTYRYYIGAVMMNMAIMGGIALLPTLAVLIAFLVDKQATSLLDAMRTVCYPGIVAAPIVLFMMPTLTSSLKVLYFGQQRNLEEGERTLSSLFVVLTFAFVSICAVKLRRLGSIPQVSRNLSALHTTVLGHWTWVDRDRSSEGFTRRFGALFRETVPSKSWYFLVELVFMILFGVLDAPTTATMEACRVIQLCGSVLFTVYFIMLLRLRPFQSRAKTVLLTASAFFECASVVSGALLVDATMSIIAMALLAGSFACLLGLVVVHVAQIVLLCIADPPPPASASILLADASDAAVTLAPTLRGVDLANDELAAKWYVAPLSSNPLDYERKDRLPITPAPPKPTLTHLPGYEAESDGDDGDGAAAPVSGLSPAMEQFERERRDDELWRML